VRLKGWTPLPIHSSEEVGIAGLWLRIIGGFATVFGPLVEVPILVGLVHVVALRLRAMLWTDGCDAMCIRVVLLLLVLVSLLV
jgi:hypothetical protein